ncbi:MAG: MlaD family protein [Fibrobacterales bacterium]
MNKLLGLKHFDPRDFNNLFVGAFLSFGILFFIVLTVYILLTNDYFVKEYSLYCNFDKGLGLREGAAVQVNGVEVGHVDRVFLANDGSVQLELKIRKIKTLSSKWIYNPHITTSSVVYATRDQNLISGRIIFISHGTDNGSILTPGQFITSNEAQDIETVLTNVLKLINKFEKIANATDTLITMSKDPSSSIGSLLADNTLYTTIMKQLHSLDTLNQRANSVVSMIHKDMGPLLNRADTIVNNVVEISKKGNKLINNVDTTLVQIGSIVLQTDTLITNLNNLMANSEEKIERADDLVKSISSFWFIENSLPDLNTIPLIEDDIW